MSDAVRIAAEQRAEHLGNLHARSEQARDVQVGAARSLAFPAEIRARVVDHNGSQRNELKGHASVTDRWYEMWDMFGPYEEMIESRAFDATLAADPDVSYLINHRGLTLARTRSSDLELNMDDVGLFNRALVNPKRTDVKDLVIAIEDGQVTEMSFAFMLEEGWWSEDFTQFRISKLDIDRGDVSAVTYGANPYTDVSARSREIMADLDRLPAGAARAAIERLSRRKDVPRLDIKDQNVITVEEVREREVPKPAERTVPDGVSMLQLAAFLEREGVKTA